MLVTVIGGLLGLAALGAAGWAVREYARTRATLRRAETWPYRKGTITRSEVVCTQKGLRGHAIFEPRIEYTFELDGKSYAGTTVDLGGGEMNLSIEGPAQRVCERYPLGATVEVWYDPVDPGCCCLERKGPSLTSVAIAALIFAAVMGAVVLHVLESF